MSESSKPHEPLGTYDSLPLDERKFRLDERRFEFERSKSRGFGFFNSNFGVLITAIIGFATVTVSIVQHLINRETTRAQLELQTRAAENQINLEREKAKIQKDRDDRAFLFELSRFLAEKTTDLNTDDERKALYLRDIVFSGLPSDIAIKITKKMADNSSSTALRAIWNDGYVNIQLDASAPYSKETKSIVTVDYITSVFPQINNENNRKALSSLLSAAIKYNIKDEIETVTFISLVLTMTSNLRFMEENLNYTNPQRLISIYPRAFKNLDDASLVVGSPEKIANRIYANRLGNTDPDDGWKYRGRGFFQITGRAQYATLSKLIGTDLINDPDALSDFDISARAAAALFARIEDDERRSIGASSRRINGSYQGLAQAQAIFERLLPQAPKVTQGLTITSGEAPGSTARRANEGELSPLPQ